MALVLEMAGLVPNFNVAMHWYLNPWVLLMLQPIKSWFHSKQKLTGRVRSRFRFNKNKIWTHFLLDKYFIYERFLSIINTSVHNDESYSPR